MIMIIYFISQFGNLYIIGNTYVLATIIRDNTIRSIRVATSKNPGFKVYLLMIMIF